MIKIPATLLLILSLAFSGSTLTPETEAHFKDVAKKYLTQQHSVLSVQQAPKATVASNVSVLDLLQGNFIPDTQVVKNITPVVAPLLAPASITASKTVAKAPITIQTDTVTPMGASAPEFYWDANDLESRLALYDTYDGQVFSYLFNGYKGDKLDLHQLDTSNAIDMHHMFYNCTLTELDISTLKTENLETAGFMFEGATIQTLKLPDFHFPYGSNMHRMFAGATIGNLSPIKFLSVLKVPVGMREMFLDAKIPVVDLSANTFAGYDILVEDAFKGAQINTVYVKSQADIDYIRENHVSPIPAGINFVVK